MILILQVPADWPSACYHLLCTPLLERKFPAGTRKRVATALMVPENLWQLKLVAGSQWLLKAILGEVLCIKNMNEHNFFVINPP